MVEFNYIEFQKTRDFSNKMNATIEFIKQNFKSLSKALLYLAGPPAIVASLLIGSVFNDYMTLATGVGTPGGQEAFLGYLTSVNFWGSIILLVLLGTITVVMLTATVNNFVVIYMEKQRPGIEVDEVWSRIKKTFWGYFVAFLGYIFLVVVAYLVLIAVVFAAGAIAPVLSIFVAIGMFIGFMYVLIAASLVYAIQGFEKGGFFHALSRSFILIRGKWWSTFGLLMVNTIIIYIISFIFIIPWYISFIGKAIHSIEDRTGAPDLTFSWFGILSITIYYLVYFLLSAVPQLALVFQYFNLVEMKESKGLMEKMETMGVADQSQVGPKEDY